jgi:hypothetical protein
MQSQAKEFQSRSAERLYLAVVNQAISDVLENGFEAKEAERWLLSKDFDTLDKLFKYPARLVDTSLQRNQQGAR